MKKEQLFKTARLQSGEFVRIEFDHWSDASLSAHYRVYVCGGDMITGRDVYLGVKSGNDLKSFCL